MSSYRIQVRRKDRENNSVDFLNRIMRESMAANISIEKEGFPFLMPSFFAFDQSQQEIIFHASKHGFAGEQMLDGKKVCLSVFKAGKLYTAKKASDFGGAYESVIIYGKLELIKKEEERMASMKLFFAKFFGTISNDKYEDFTLQEMTSIHVFRIKIENWIGKSHPVPETAISSFSFLHRP